MSRYFATIHQNIKLIMSGHDTFPLKYGWITKTYNQIQQHHDIHNVFLKDSAIADFGVGKNMLNAMRHWSLYTGMIVRNRSTHALYNSTPEHLHSLSELDINPWLNKFYNAENLLNPDTGLDPFLESPTTLWLLHWTLATNPNLITYYWFFNINNKSELSKEDFLYSLKNFMQDYAITAPSDSTIKKDIECFIQNYASKLRKKNEDMESILESPFVELDLISRNKKSNILSLRGKKDSLTLNTFLYCLMQFWKTYNTTANTLSLEMATYDECSVGRIFMLDEDAIIEYAEKLEQSHYPIIWLQSAGIKQFQLIDSSLDDILQQTMNSMIEQDYQR